MSRGWWRHAFGVLLFLIIASCSGGGCSSGCAGCGMTPLAGGFPNASRIDNSASVRLTRPGLDFIATNIPTIAQKILKGGTAGIIQFPIPTSTTQVNIPLAGNTTITICPPGPNPNATPELCTADINIGSAKLNVDAVTPHSVKVTGTIPVRLQDLPIDTGLIGVIDIGLGNGSCNGGTPNVDYKDFPLDIELPLIAETISPRDGFTKVDTANMVVNFGIQKGDVQACKDCGLFSPICDAILGFIKDLAFNTLKNTIEAKLKSTLADRLCTAPIATATPPCPFGSQPDSGNAKCVYTSDPTTCVPMELGLEGHMNLGKALQGISPGTTGGLDIILAAGGDMDPAPDSPPDDNPYVGHTPNGITLGMLGGALQNPQSTCVPIAPNPLPTGIPIPDEMKADKLTPWPANDPTGPHVGVALAGRYLNYAFGSAYNSGVLCLGISTETFQKLNSGLLSALVPSIKNLTFERQPAAAAVTTRPQSPPTVKIGTGKDLKTDPLLKIQLNRFAVDFYIWSDDRFVRAFTFTGDLTIPLNLQTAKDPVKNPKGGLLPVLGDIVVANATVTNNDLLTDDPATVSAALGAILGGISGQFTGSLKAFDLSGATKSLGLALTIPDGGIRKLSKGTDDYLAIFADFSIATTQSLHVSHTNVRLLEKTVHPEAMTLSTFDRAKLPSLHVALSSTCGPGCVADLPSPLDDAAAPVEYSWWIDDGTRSAWSPERDLTIQTDYLFLQGKHTLFVSSRVAGAPDTEDATPAAIPFAVDTLAPHVAIKESAGGVTVDAWDFVSANADLVARTRVDPEHAAAAETLGAWSAWAPLASLGTVSGEGSAVTVEVRDEEGNVGSATVALIRGRPDPSLKGLGAGCGCSVPGGSSGASGAWLLALAGAIVLGARRARDGRSATQPGQHLTAASFARGARPLVAATFGVAFAVVAATSQGCACGSSDSGGAKSGCGPDCNSVCGAALPQGLIGSYTSVAKAADGTIWVSGYNEAVITSDVNGLYGDLVVGKYDSGKAQVAWTTVDGLPPAATDGTCPNNDPHGWRNGLTDPGDDVGLWTSLELDANNNPMVSYYDATHKALKFASFDGTNWASHTVVQAPGSDIGRYAKMLVVNGNPVIAFLVMEKGTQGRVRSKVALATASTATPAQGGDWKIEDAAVDENGPCRAAFCGTGETCIKETNTCQGAVSGCTPPDCGGAGSVCATIAGKPACGTAIDNTYIDIYPNAFADYISMASGPQGLGIVVYDRLHGNLVGVSKAGGGWATIIFDGETGSRAPGSNGDGGVSAVDTGDVGVGASLFITANGDWHVSYVNGFTESLQYILVPGGKPSLKPEIVDDGTKLDGKAFADGTHIVGDDSFLQVDGNGVVTISYQDATAGTLRGASGTPGAAGTHQWSFHAVPQDGRFAGFFPHAIPGDPQVANWWRHTDHATKDVTGDVSFVNR